VLNSSIVEKIIESITWTNLNVLNIYSAHNLSLFSIIYYKKTCTLIKLTFQALLQHLLGL